MTRTESVALQEVHRPASTVQREMDSEAVPPEASSSTAREAKLTMRDARVMAGQALLQLPIWGFAMGFGVFQEHFSEHWTLAGSQSATGVIGTTSNGVMYMAMPFLFAGLSRGWAERRRAAALAGTALASGSFLVASWSSAVWQLVAALGVAAALGCSLMYSPTTLSLGEHFYGRRRGLAYGVVLSCKNVVGSTCPFLFRLLLDRVGLRQALRVWAAVTAVSGVAGVVLVLGWRGSQPETRSSSSSSRLVPWRFLRHSTFYVYAVATVLQSAGYGLPQTYLNTYARDVSQLSGASATLLLTLFNVPGIASSAFFGLLSDDRVRQARFRPLRRLQLLSTAAVTGLSAVSAALAVWLLWGLAARGDMALLVLFALIFGFFAGGYSATWAAVMSDLEQEAAQRNEAIDSGVVYGLLNGARGIGYVGGGLVGVSLLRSGTAAVTAAAGSTWGAHGGYGSSYGPLIIFTGLSTVFGGCGLLWKAGRAVRLL